MLGKEHPDFAASLNTLAFLYNSVGDYARASDGALGRLPLAPLPGKEPGSYLIEDHRLVLIPVPQELPGLMREAVRTALPHELLAMGDINYDSAPTSDADQQTPTPSLPSETSFAMRSSGSLPTAVRGESHWGALAGTGPEVQFIADLVARQQSLPADAIVKLSQSSASETAFRRFAPTSRIVHLATHGFFAAPDKQSALSAEMIAASGKDQMMSLGDKPHVFQGYNPGQLSGLVFAGANNKRGPLDAVSLQTSNSELHTSDDGILTADEIAFLRLEGCDWQRRHGPSLHG